ncbi:MAG: hypothetical protein ACM32J_13590, partial [Rhizobacter sp.]
KRVMPWLLGILVTQARKGRALDGRRIPMAISDAGKLNSGLLRRGVILRDAAACGCASAGVPQSGV